MSNLSDLLPAGAAAKQLTFTDSGSGIATKKPVILNSDGTVAEVAGSTTSAAVADVQDIWASTTEYNYNAIVYASTEDRFVAISSNNDTSSYPEYSIGTMSSGSITWGTPVVITSNAVDWLDAIYHSNTGRLVLIYTISSQAQCIIGTFGSSPYTTISWAGQTQAYSQTTTYLYHQIEEWPGTDKFVIASLYVDTGTSYRGIMQVGTIGGASTLSFGTEENYTSGSISNYPSFTQLMYDTNVTDQFILVYQVATTAVHAQRCPVSGTTISSNIAGTVISATVVNNCLGAAWDADEKKALVMYGVTPTSGTGIGTTSLVVVYTTPGNLFVGTPIAFVSGASSNQYAGSYWNSLVYDSFRKVFAISYLATDLSQYVTQATISTTTPVLSGTHTTATGAYSQPTTTDATFDTNSNLVVYMACNGLDANKVGTYVYTPEGSGTNLTATNFVGVADSAISASAAGSVIVQGGTVTGVASGTGISLGTAVEVAVANSQPESITYDTNANKIVLAYQDAGSSYHGYAAVGTVSGTSISFGTPVLINAGAHYYGSSCYDSTNNKVILVYTDGSNSNYLTAIVGTVSGTSISFGSPAVVSSQNYVDWAACAYDTNEQKVVVAYKDKGNSNYGTGVVGTVSGTSISFGTPTAFNSSDSTPMIAVYDSNAQKVVIDYWDTGNSYYGTAVVGTVSGTSISFGSPVVYNAAQVTNLGGCFDSTNNKVVITYLDTGNSNYGTALVGTVSGTSISFGSEAVFVTQQAGWNRCAYDTNAQKVIVSTANATDTSGQLYAGTVSGTDISFGTAVTFDSDGTSQNAITYDSSSNQIVLAYQAYSDSYKAKAVVGSFGDLPLTVGAKYYVTTSGGFSSSADTPSVNAGLAISTTSLLLNGDS